MFTSSIIHQQSWDRQCQGFLQGGLGDWSPCWSSRGDIPSINLSFLEIFFWFWKFNVLGG
jgi:hypothetical protein